MRGRVGALRGRVRRERWREKKGGEAIGTSMGEMLLATTGKRGREERGLEPGRVRDGRARNEGASPRAQGWGDLSDWGKGGGTRMDSESKRVTAFKAWQHLPIPIGPWPTVWLA